jgi:acyl carrier protein
MNTTVFNTIQGFLTKTFYVNPHRVKPYTRIYEDLKLSQMEFLEMVMIVENEYHVQLADGELGNCKKINDLAKMTERALGRI